MLSTQRLLGGSGLDRPRSVLTPLSPQVPMAFIRSCYRGFAIGTFMDIEGVFKHTSSEVIRRAMIRQGVPIAVVD